MNERSFFIKEISHDEHTGHGSLWQCRSKHCGCLPRRRGQGHCPRGGHKANQEAGLGPGARLGQEGEEAHHPVWGHPRSPGLQARGRGPGRGPPPRGPHPASRGPLPGLGSFGQRGRHGQPRVGHAGSRGRGRPPPPPRLRLERSCLRRPRRRLLDPDERPAGPQPRRRIWKDQGRGRSPHPRLGAALRRAQAGRHHVAQETRPRPAPVPYAP